jgi:hypothetical protein
MNDSRFSEPHHIKVPYRLSSKWLKNQLQKNYEISENYRSCNHHLSVRKATTTNNRLSFRLVCNYCGEFFCAVSKKDIVNLFDFEELKEKDDELRTKFLNRKNEFLEQRNARTYEMFNDSWNHNTNRKYDEYLLTEEWRKKRQLVLNRCKNMCEGCGINQADAVHHLTYEHIYDEFLFELIGICNKCHDKIHDKSAEE